MSALRHSPPCRSPQYRRGILVGGVLAAVAANLGLSTSPARALGPESPEVKKVVAKAIKYLEQPVPDEVVKAERGFNAMFGARALVGMCMVKWYGDVKGRNHPIVLEAVEAIRQGIRVEFANVGEFPVYNAGVSLIFLFEVDHDAYRPEMEKLTQYLIRVQKPHGGWGYGFRQTGDTSMSQYGVLGLWAAANSEIDTPVSAWEGISNWLMRTQDPSGGYSYQGTDPGNFNLVPQTAPLTESLTAAALGSLALSADHLRIYPREQKRDPNLPAALKLVVKTDFSPLTKLISQGQVNQTLERGENWMQRNSRIDPPEWAHYYLYALERYRSVREELFPNEKNNRWYDDGYAFLAKTQRPDGSWKGEPYEHIVPDTSFGVLFLLRSMRKSIEKAKSFGGGLLTGGRLLPDNASEIEFRQGSVRAKPLQGPAMELLSKMTETSPDDPELERLLEGLEQQSLVNEEDHLSDVQKKLRAMAQGKSPEARAAALRVIGRTRSLDDVPLLIEALKDEDAQIYLAADEALRFISRKFTGTGKELRREVIDVWKKWYRAIRPDAEFQDE